jgi:methionyl-tRNA formyltransferase
MLQRRRKRLGLWQVAQQVLFLVWDRLYIRAASRKRISELLHGHDITPPDSQVRTIDVSNINASGVVQIIRNISPTCGVISGTSILRRPLIESVPVWLNIHCGITPRYRGVHGAFWAIYEGSPELAGVTIHKTDLGVDTGGIIIQDKIEIESTDTYRTLPVKQYLRGIPLMIEAVERVLKSSHIVDQRTDLESKLWYTPTISAYLKFRRQVKVITGR